MSLNHSPSIVTNGLVFAYDMANTQKSWKGAPTTNLITNPLPDGTVTGYVSAGGAGTTTYDVNYQAIKWVRTTYETWGAYHYVNPMFNGNLSTSATYSISFEWRTENNFANSVYTYELVQGNGVSPAVSVNMLSNSILQSNGWYLFKYSFVPANTGVSAYNRVILASQGTNVSTFYWRKVQFEQQPFPTPFVIGTRSNTQSIIDLTGTNTVTISGLTYASDGTFSFTQPSSNFISVPLNNQFLSTGFTVNVWMNYSNVGANDNVISWGLNAFNNTSYAWEIRIRGNANANVEFSPGVGPGGTGTPLRLQYNQGSTPLNGRTSLITVTFVANGVATFYENGIFKASTDYTGIGTYSTTNTLYIGRGTDSFFSGKIHATQIYNRALSAAEVKQNFNALRGRYGI